MLMHKKFYCFHLNFIGQGMIKEVMLRYLDGIVEADVYCEPYMIIFEIGDMEKWTES